MGSSDNLLGALDLLILRVLSAGPRHGYGIARRIEESSDDVLSVQQGSLYPALHRLEKKAFLTSTWTEGEGGKRIKVYTLTKAGRAYMVERRSSWELASAAITLVLKNA